MDEGVLKIMDYKRDLGKMISLIERIEGNMTPRQAMLNEEKCINEAVASKPRVILSINKFFEGIDKLKGGGISTFGYVTSANLNLPTVKRRNPDTNRMKSYPDYSGFNSEHEIAALIKITAYNFPFRHRKSVNDEYYNRYRPAFNSIRAEYGLDPVKDSPGYTRHTEWGPSVYNGENDELRSHSYWPQNLAQVNREQTHKYIYIVDKDGHIVNDKPLLKDDEILPYVKQYNVDGVAALRKMGVDEERIKEYIQKVKDLKFSYKNFESNSILWAKATDEDGVSLFYFNPKMERAVDSIMLRAEDFRPIVRELCQEDMARFEEEEQRSLENTNIR